MRKGGSEGGREGVREGSWFLRAGKGQISTALAHQPQTYNALFNIH